MGKVNSGWVRRQVAVLLSATLALSPIAAVPAIAAEAEGDAPAVEATLDNDVEKVEEGAVENNVEPAEESATEEAQPVEDGSPESGQPEGATNDALTSQAEGAIMFNGEAYETLTAAFAAAAGGGTITLTDDVTVTKSTDADARGLTGDVTLDLGGHTVNGANGNIAIRVINSDGGSLTIVNGSIIAQQGTYCTVGASAADLTLDGVTLHNETQYGMSVKAFDAGHIVLKNCTSSSTNGSGAITAAGGTVDVYGGTFVQSGYYDHNSSLLAPANGTGTINVYGGSFVAEGSGIYVFSSGGTLNFYDGSLEVTGERPAVRGDISYEGASGSINIYGGSISGSFQSIDNRIDVRVSGGTFSSNTVESYLAPGFVYEGGTVAKDENAVVTVSNSDGVVVGAYESLQEAVNAVPAGGTVALTDNVTGNGVKVDDNREFTLDLGGFTYTVDGGLVGSVGTETNGFQLLQGNDVTIKNGRISSDKALILIQNYSDLVLEDVDLVGGATTQYVLSNNCGEVHIGRGTTITASRGQAAFDVCRFGNYDSVRVTVDEGAGAIVGRIEVADANGTGTGAWSLTINGGDLSQAELSVQNADEATIEKSPSVALPAPDGYQWVDGELAKESDPAVKTVASITDEAGNVTYFSTLAEAVKAAGDSQTIALLGDVTESVSVPDGVSVTLDLAGHTLTNADGQHTVTVEKGGSLTIVDSSADKTGVIDNVTHGRGALVNYGTVTVESGELTRSAEASKSPTDNGGNSWYVVDNQGTMTFNDGSVVNESHYSSLVRNLNGTLTINGGTFENPFIALKNDDGGTLTVAGGTVTSEEQAIQSWSTTTVSGGTLNGRVTSWDYEDSGNESLLTVSGGTINGDVQAINYMGAEKGPEVVITGGTITGKVQKATHDGTGTKPADPTADTSTITISGGTFASPIDDALIVPGSGLNKNDDGTYGVHEHKAEAVAAVAPTCDKDGNKAHWRCGVCGELFADEAMTQPVAAEDVVLPATHHANATHVAAVEPTETTAGNYEYWHCPDCGRYFADAALTQETTLAALTRPALGQEPVETHTVTFDFGTGEPSKTVTVADGEAVPRPDDPTHEGWTFAGWYTERAEDGSVSGLYDFSTPVTGDLTLYAGWYEKEAEEGVKPTTPTIETGDKTGDVLASTGDTTSAAAPLAAAVLGASAVAAGVVARRRKE